MSTLQLKWLGMAALVGLSLLLLYPSMQWYSTDTVERDRLEAARWRPTWLINLGLDLRGGTHLLMELETAKLPSHVSAQEGLNQAIEILRNRVDQFGVAEPFIARQGDRWIVVQLPGLTNAAQAKALVGKTALLEFRLVDNSATAQQALQQIVALGRPFEHGQIKATVVRLLPPGTTLLPGRDEQLYLVTKAAQLTGAALETARMETGGQYGMPVVAFTLRPTAATPFANLTGANLGKQLAIVLDGVVYSAPVIRSAD